MLVALDAGGEVGTEALPGIAAIGGLEQVIAAVIKRLRIVGGNDHRRIPLETVARRLVILFERTDGARFSGAKVAAQQVAILGFGVNDIGVGWIHLRVEAVAPAYGDPFVVRDAARHSGGAGATPRIIVLQAAAQVIRLLHVVSDLVILADRNVVDVIPVAAAVVGHGYAAIRAQDHMIGIRGIDP